MLFVCGVGRSGTSLLQSMLAAHPEIDFLPETSFIRRYVFPRTLEKQMKAGGVESVASTLDDDLRIQHLGMDSSGLTSGLANDSPLDIAIYRQIVARLSRESAKLVGDKDPRMVELLPLVHSHFPNSYLVHLVRDPRDVLVSKQKASWSRSRAWWQHAFANRVQFELGQSNGRRYFADRYCVMLYEELLAEPEKILRKLCETIGIEYADEMLTEFGEAAKRLVRADEMQWKSETTGPLLKKNVGKWQESLSPFQVATTERVCRPNMRFGEYSHSNTRGMAANLGRCFGGLLSVMAPVYQFVRNRQATAAIKLS